MTSGNDMEVIHNLFVTTARKYARLYERLFRGEAGRIHTLEERVRGMAREEFCRNTPEIEALAQLAVKNSTIQPEDYKTYGVMRGLRDQNG